MARRILLQVLSVEELFKDTITANIAEATAKKVLWTSPFVPFFKNVFGSVLPNLNNHSYKLNFLFDTSKLSNPPVQFTLANNLESEVFL